MRWRTWIAGCGAAGVTVVGALAFFSFVSVDTVTCASVDVRLLTSTTMDRLRKKYDDERYHFSSLKELTNLTALLKLTCFKQERYWLAYGAQDSIMYMYNPNDDNNHNKGDDGRQTFRNYTWIYSYGEYKLLKDMRYLDELTVFGYVRVKNEARGPDKGKKARSNQGPAFEELFGGLRYTYESLKTEFIAGRQWLELGRGFVYYDTMDALRFKAQYEWHGTVFGAEPIIGKVVGDNWDSVLNQHEENHRLVVAVPLRLDLSAETFWLDPEKYDWIGIQSLRPYYAQVFDQSQDVFQDGDSQYNAYYFGGQMFGPLYFEGLMYNLEGVLVGGNVNDYMSEAESPVHAWLYDTEISYENDFALCKHDFPYKLIAGYTVGSGDGTALSTTATRYGNWPGTDARVFRGISGSYPLKPPTAGFEPANLRTLHLEGWLTCYESEEYGTVKLGTAFYQFWKTDKRGYIADEDYHTDPRWNNATSYNVGTEFDGFLTYEWRDWFEIRTTVGGFIVGPAYPSDANDSPFLTQLLFTFKL